jgi:hypothetical protein
LEERRPELAYSPPTQQIRLLHTLRGLAPKTSFWHDAQFDTIRLALIKVAGRVTELAARIKLVLPSDYPYQASLTLFAARAARPP